MARVVIRRAPILNCEGPALPAPMPPGIRAGANSIQFETYITALSRTRKTGVENSYRVEIFYAVNLSFNWDTYGHRQRN